MRIAIVSPFDPSPEDVEADRAHVGGVERALWQLARHLAQRGHEVDVVCSSRAASSTTRVEEVRLWRRKRRLTVFRTPLASLARAIPAEAQLVQVPATYPLTTPFALRHASRRGQTVVLDFHFEPSPPQQLARWGATFYRSWARHVYPAADRVVVRSAAYAERASSIDRVPRSKWRFIPNGVDPDLFRPQGSPSMDGPVLFVGRLVPYKGVDVLLEAYRRSGIERPLWIAGDGPEAARLQALARRLGVRPRFLGRVEDAELPRLYRAAGFTVLPSVNGQEAFGMALLESMACGTPVVSSDLPGVKDVARLGGITAPAADVDAWAQALRWADGADWGRGQALAQKIHDHYSWQAVARRFERVYEEALQPVPVAWSRDEVEAPCAYSS